MDRMSTRLRRLSLIAMLLVSLSVSFSAASPAALAVTTINVTTTVDEVNTDGDCSLREATIAANTDLAVDACPQGNGADLILIPAGTYTIIIPPAGMNGPADGDFDLIDSVTVRGAGRASTFIDGGSLDRVFEIRANTQGVKAVMIERLEIRNGQAASGGGILATNNIDLTVSDVIIHSSFAQAGGGIDASGVHGLFVLRNIIQNNHVTAAGDRGNGGGISIYSSQGMTIIEDTTIANNTAREYGGGISFFDGSAAGNAIRLEVYRSTINGNTAHRGGGVATRDGRIPGKGSTLIENSTISGNVADRDFGGGIDAGTNTVVELNNVTISRNTTAYRAGGLFVDDGATVTLRNTILAGNKRSTDGLAFDCATRPDASLMSEGYNLIGTLRQCTLAGDSTGNLIGVSPQLGSLFKNGGLTRTHALLNNSPAVDTGNPAVPGSGGTACAGTDQRGVVRPVDGDGDTTALCDIGAYEK